MIDGEYVRVAPNWTISDKINSRTTLSITVVDLLNLDKIDNGDEIKIIDNSEEIFVGVVRNLQKREPSPNVLEYAISAVDNSALADKRIIAKVYTAQTAGYIVRDIIAEKLGEEGVIEGVIQDGPLIKKAVFNYKKCSEALDYLKKVTGYNWTIDKDKKLNFFDRSTNLAPFTLDDSVQHSNFVQDSAMDQYRNTQYTRGGKGKTASQTNETPTPKPDGESRNFVLRFPIAEKPVIEVNLGGLGWITIGPADIGVNGLDKNKKWYFSFGSQIITQDSAETALDSVNSDAVRMTYTGLRNLFVKIDDPVEINARREAETGTSGIYESLAIETSIDESDQAIQFAEGLIETYGEIKDSITFNTNVSDLKAGQLLPVQKPLYGINDDFLIESVTIRPDGNLILYSVKALDGASIGGWEEFFKELLKGNRDFVIAENEVLILLQTQSESEGYQGSYDIKVVESDYPAEDAYPAEDSFPGTITSEVTIND